MNIVINYGDYKRAFMWLINYKMTLKPLKQDSYILYVKSVILDHVLFSCCNLYYTLNMFFIVYHPLRNKYFYISICVHKYLYRYNEFYLDAKINIF